MSGRTAAERVALARHPGRPGTADYIAALCTDFFEQKGDRQCREDPAILGGVALFHGRPVTVLGHRKGKNLEENLKCNFGMPGPEGYRKAMAHFGTDAAHTIIFEDSPTGLAAARATGAAVFKVETF